MKKFFDFLFSMQFSGTLMLVFAAAIGTATFVENDLGTLAAKLIVYEAIWFELLMLLMAISMLGSVFKYKLYTRKKYTVLLFHISFVVILIGAGITRYGGYEGTMSIREGSSSNEIVSEHSYITVDVEKDGQLYHFDHKKLFSPYNSNKFDKEIEFGNDFYELSLSEFVPNAAETIQEDPNGYPILSLVTVGRDGRMNVFLSLGEIKQIGKYTFAFENPAMDSTMVQVKRDGDQLKVTAPFTIGLTSMGDGSVTGLESFDEHPFDVMKLYQFGATQIVVKAYYPKAATKVISAAVEDPKANYNSAAVMRLYYKGENREVILYGGKGFLADPVDVTIQGVKFTISYGSKKIKIPFALYLRDFQLDRYPGSMSPSSFASEVTLIDERIGLKEDRRIFMNNVLNHDGYRFFQSYYDKDEKGTILSVNHDRWGTNVTYFGYFIMALGMILNFFHRDSRFRQLMRASKGVTTIIVFGVIMGIGLMKPSEVNAQQTPMQMPAAHQLDVSKPIHPDHAKEFGKLLVLDQKGRIEPINTLASEIVRKVTKKGEFMDMSPDQIFLGMLSNPQAWQNVKMIKVSNTEIKRLIGIRDKYASFNDFIDFQKGGSYKLGGLIDKAYNKKPAARNAFDKEIIKVDERVNIAYMVYTGDFLKIFPLKDDPNNSWLTAAESQKFDSLDAGFVKNILPMYYGSLNSRGWSEAAQNLSYIKTFQDKFGSEIFPPKAKIKLEVIYNNVNIFKRLFPFFALVGFVMLILLFMGVLNPKYEFKKVILVAIILFIIGFIFLSLGLTARWYISGHAPWSNGYESMIYIAWATVLTGVFFIKKSKITVAITAILSSFTLMVAHMSWMDPEITNLVPVLKSYWLVIHVAIITASYASLGIGALIGFFNLMLMNLKNPKNKQRLDDTIKELTNINEMNLIMGGFLLTIGTFLGAVWANESWGRYWGWDPKETWALVTVVVYAFVVHMRLTPGLKGTYAFNFAALISFSSVLMTYFGVNYYLSGMHSYAQGDPVPIPTFVYYTIIIIAVVSFMAYRNEKKFLPKEK